MDTAAIREKYGIEPPQLIDVKSLYRMDELKASGLRFWRL